MLLVQNGSLVAACSVLIKKSRIKGGEEQRWKIEDGMKTMVMD